MIIYFADRKINILGMASTSLPNGLRIYDDLTVEDVSSGVNTFSCSIDANDQDRQVLEDAVKEGYYILPVSNQINNLNEDMFFCRKNTSGYSINGFNNRMKKIREINKNSN